MAIDDTLQNEKKTSACGNNFGQNLDDLLMYGALYGGICVECCGVDFFI